MIKHDDDYQSVVLLKSADLMMLTETEFVNGKRPGVMTLECGQFIFREAVRTRGMRSKPMARTQHISILERPDGSISGTFHFNPNEKRITGKLKEELEQALGVAMIEG